VKDVLIGEDTITIRHSIPVLQSPPRGGCLPPSQTSGPNYLLCKGSALALAQQPCARLAGPGVGASGTSLCSLRRR
jgi:hypothetical protein